MLPFTSGACFTAVRRKGRWNGAGAAPESPGAVCSAHFTGRGGERAGARSLLEAANLEDGNFAPLLPERGRKPEFQQGNGQTPNKS